MPIMQALHLVLVLGRTAVLDQQGQVLDLLGSTDDLALRQADGPSTHLETGCWQRHHAADLLPAWGHGRSSLCAATAVAIYRVTAS